MKKNLALYIGLVFVLVALVSAIVLSVPTFGGKVVSFDSTYGKKNVTLKGTYWEVKGSEYAVLVCPGYSCDREKWRPMANLFVGNGLTTMTFDYAGQGASTGTIGFDNAKTDAIPVEISDAIEKLHELSGIPYEKIILVGHSLGGRSILRLLYDYNNPNAVTTVPKRNIKNVILFSAAVNYYFNAQASLFAGTTDEAESPWDVFGASDVADSNVYLFGSTADDIVFDEDVLAMYNRLGGSAPQSGMFEGSVINNFGSKITVRVSNLLLHSYMMFSPKYAVYTNEALSEITGAPASYPAARIFLTYVSWISALVGLGFVFFSLTRGAKEPANDSIPVITDMKAFLLRKLFLWLPGIAMAFVVCCICVVMPFGSPIMNIPYMCFIAGYGLVMLLAYRKGLFKGTEGRLPRPSFQIAAKGCELAKAIVITVVSCAFVWFVLWCTMYRLIPLNVRLFWVVFASVLMAVGYYISGVENDMLDSANASAKVRFLYNLIQYVALFLFVLFYLVIKSYSGLIGQIQNMILMYIFCIPLGDYLRRKTSNRLVGAVVTAFLFQTLMITSAALISFF